LAHKWFSVHEHNDKQESGTENNAMSVMGAGQMGPKSVWWKYPKTFFCVNYVSTSIL